MIDFHTHILPNLDDGAKSAEETFKLIKEAKKAGFEGTVLTSHYVEGYYETDEETREQLLKIISKDSEVKNSNVKLFLASEIYISDKMIELLEDAKASTINNTSYILVELPFKHNPVNLKEMINMWISNKLVPVIAHPERYEYIQKSPNKIYDLIQEGALMQCNYGSFIGQYGKDAKLVANILLKNNMIHFLGSDVHKANTIYPRIPEIVKQLENIVGKEQVEEITSINPKLALNNKKIFIREPKKIELNLIDKVKLQFKIY